MAPSVFGLNEVKRGVVCMLFGGVAKEVDCCELRGEIHVLLLGHVGIGKSRLLYYVSVLSPNGVYAAGHGVTVVGLTT